jgi:hypothetical protein
MKKQPWYALLLSLILTTVLISGCTIFSQVTGAGEVISRLYNFTGFTEIKIGTAIDFEIVPLDSYSISVKTHQNIFDYINISQSGKTLFINLKPIKYSKVDLTVTITLPVLNRVVVSGTSHGKVKGFSSDQNFKLDASGDSTLDLDVEAGAAEIHLDGTTILVGRLVAARLNLEMFGDSRTSLNGSSANLLLKASGNSLANLPEFAVRDASVFLAKTSQANLTLSGNLDAELTGISRLNYSGSPALGDIKVSGDSKISGP